MSHPALTVADAVVAALNAAEFSVEFTAARRYVPRFDAEDGSDVQVQVVPRSDREGDDGTVGYDSREVVIQIGIFKRLSGTIAGETAECDAVMDLCEEIRAALNRARVGDSSEAVCVAVDHEPIYSVEDIDERRVLLTVPAFTFLIDVEV